jgi:lipopolysaccharide export LptBFGC system permease protein LptF
LRAQYVDALGWAVLIVWVLSMAVDPFVRSYDPPPVVHGLMTIIVTAAFGAGLIRRNGD